MTRAGTVTMTQRPDLAASTTVLRLDSDLGLAAASALRLRLMSALRPGTKRLVVAAPSPPVAELLHSTGLERYLAVCPDLPGALVTRPAPAGIGPR